VKNNFIFFLLLIFVFLTGILSAVVYFNRQKIFDKGTKTLPTTTETPEVIEPTKKTSSQLSPSPIPTQEEFSHWQTFTNTRFSYKFRYDPSWRVSSNCNTDNNCAIQGDVSQKGWPDIAIGKKFYSGIADLAALENKLKADFPEANIRQLVFSPKEIPAVFVSFPRSPQAYASESYYFFHKGEILAITFNDTDNNQAQKIYNFFLLNFEPLND